MKIYFALVGCLILSLGIYLLYRRITFLKKAQSIEGKVISYEARRHKQGYIYHPVIQFHVEQNIYSFTSPAGSGWKQYPEGQAVPVRYHLDNPQNAFIDSFLHFWAAPVGCMVLGIAGVAVIFVK